MTNTATSFVAANHSQRFLPFCFPASLVHVLDRSIANGIGGFRVRRRQSGTDLLLQIGHRAQADRHAEHLLDQFLDATLAHALVAGQITDDAGQLRPDAVRQHFRRDRRTRDLAATWASAGVSLMFGDGNQHLGQLDHLVPGRLGIDAPRDSRQRCLTMLTRLGNVGDGIPDEFERQTALDVRRMARLAAWLAAGWLLVRSRRHVGARTRWRLLALQPRRQVLYLRG